jgi:hypothetical protein
MSQPNGVEKPSFDLLHYERHTSSSFPPFLRQSQKRHSQKFGYYEFTRAGIVAEESSIPVDRCVSRCLLIISLLILVWPFDEFAVDEEGAGADEGDQVGRVDHPPSLLR